VHVVLNATLVQWELSAHHCYQSTIPEIFHSSTRTPHCLRAGEHPFCSSWYFPVGILTQRFMNTCCFRVFSASIKVPMILRGVALQQTYDTHVLGVTHLSITNSVEWSPSGEAKSHTPRQEIPCLLWKPKVHYRVHNILPPVPSWTRWIQSITPTLFP